MTTPLALRSIVCSWKACLLYLKSLTRQSSQFVFAFLTLKCLFVHFISRVHHHQVIMPCDCKVKSAVGPSILNCNFVQIKEEVSVLVAAGIDFIHLDVMDGNFVDDITFGPAFVKSLIQEFPGQKFEVHMMVQYPMKFIKAMSDAGVDRYIFHYEVTKDNQGKGDYSVNDLTIAVHDHKMEAAIAINPATPVESILPYVDQLESVLVMTVVPGLGGQKFMQDMMTKVRVLRDNFPNADIELDGGVAPTNIEVCGQAGANRVVCGTALLRSHQKAQDVLSMRQALFPVQE